jgi:membrane-associated phospholipid phosphatase
MKFNRIVLYITAGVAFTLSYIEYITYIDQLGFPDGFISELGYAERALAWLFIGVSLLIGVYCLYLSWVAAKKDIGRRGYIPGMVYLLFIALLTLVGYVYRLQLISGAGG